MTLLAEYIVFAVYLALGPVLWGVLGFFVLAGRRRMDLLHRARALPQDPPKVSILIPAKDEGTRIAECLRSALASDLPDTQVIAINDRSSDDTGAVMDRLAAENPRLRVLHMDHLVDGWTGKCNALHAAVPMASAEWLLFVDSDVVLSPRAAGQVLGLALSSRSDLVSLLPRLECHSRIESVVIPFAGAVMMGLYLVPLTNHDHYRKIAFANGQILLIRREVYDAIGGHAAVRDRFTEDVEMARLVKAAGYRARITWGAELAAVRMYSTFGQIVRGWSRNFAGIARGRAGRAIMGAFFLVFSCLSVYAALAWTTWRTARPVNEYGHLGWLSAAAVHLALMTYFVGLGYRWTGNRMRNALLVPVSAGALLCIFAKSLWICATGRVEWRGTRYTGAGDAHLSATR